MKTKFVAGLIASLITVAAITSLVVVAVVFLGWTAENKILTYGGAFAAIVIWGGIYNKLKPKEKFHDQSDRKNYDDDFHN